MLSSLKCVLELELCHFMTASMCRKCDHSENIESSNTGVVHIAFLSIDTFHEVSQQRKVVNQVNFPGGGLWVGWLAISSDWVCDQPWSRQTQARLFVI